MIERREKSSQDIRAANRTDAPSGPGIIPIAASIVIRSDPENKLESRFSMGFHGSEPGDRSGLRIARLPLFQGKCFTGTRKCHVGGRVVTQGAILIWLSPHRMS
jgi:hypothetical protein